MEIHYLTMFLFSNMLTMVLFHSHITKPMVPLVIIWFLVLDNLLFESSVHTSLTTYMILTTVCGLVCHLKNIFNCFFNVSYTVLDYLINPYNFVKAGYYIYLTYLISRALDIDCLLFTSITIASTCFWYHYCIATNKSAKIVDAKVFNDVSDVSEVDFSDDSSVSDSNTEEDKKEEGNKEEGNKEEDNKKKGNKEGNREIGNKEIGNRDDEVEHKFHDREDSEEEKIDVSDSSENDNSCLENNAEKTEDTKRTVFSYPTMWCVNLYQYEQNEMNKTPFIKDSNMSLILNNTSKHIVFQNTNMRFFFTNFVANVENTQMMTLAVNKIDLGDVRKPTNDILKKLEEERSLYSIIFKSNEERKEFMNDLRENNKKKKE